MKPMIIDEEWIDKQVDSLTKSIILNRAKGLTQSNRVADILCDEREGYLAVKKQLQSPKDIVSKAFEAGRDYIDVYGFAEDEVKFVNNLEEYLKENNYE